MTYLRTLQHTLTEECWPLVGQWMEWQPQSFYTELSRERPILKLPAFICLC
jgi:hypothetical protein